MILKAIVAIVSGVIIGRIVAIIVMRILNKKARWALYYGDKIVGYMDNPFRKKS